MNMRGIRSGDVGEDARNAIQVSATASVGLRLVPAQTPAYLREVIEENLRLRASEASKADDIVADGIDQLPG